MRHLSLSLSIYFALSLSLSGSYMNALPSPQVSMFVVIVLNAFFLASEHFGQPDEWVYVLGTTSWKVALNPPNAVNWKPSTIQCIEQSSESSMCVCVFRYHKLRLHSHFCHRGSGQAPRYLACVHTAQSFATAPIAGVHTAQSFATAPIAGVHNSPSSAIA